MGNLYKQSVVISHQSSAISHQPADLVDRVPASILTQTGEFVRSIFLLEKKKRQTTNYKVQSKV
jgi:hypothetical protein